MNYYKVDIITNTLGADLLSELLWHIADGGIVIQDDKDYEEALEHSIYEDYNVNRPICEDVMITLYIDSISKLEEIESILKSLDNYEYGKLTMSYQEHAMEDYDEQWKSFHKPIKLDKIIIAPEWHDTTYEKPTLKININSSFGSGQHESTKLALQMLEIIDLKNKVVSDIGCGSGILGLASLLLGAKSSIMIDIDNIDNALYNAKLNGLVDKCIIRREDLSQFNNTADIVACNIFASVVCQYKDKIVSLVREGGMLILSGIYSESINDVLESYEDLELIKLDNVNDWSAILLKRV